MSRGVAATAVCALSTYAGHAAAGGASPDPRLLVAAAVPLAALLVALADRRRGPVAMLTLVGGSQLVMHGMLQVLGDALPATSTHDLALGGPGTPGTPGFPGMAGMPGMVGVLGTHPLLMLLAHGLVALVTAGLLAGAEDAVFTMVEALARVLPRMLAPPRLSSRPTRPVPVPTGPRDARPREALGRRLHPRRGPPALVPAGAH